MWGRRVPESAAIGRESGANLAAGREAAESADEAAGARRRSRRAAEDRRAAAAIAVVGEIAGSRKVEAPLVEFRGVDGDGRDDGVLLLSFSGRARTGPLSAVAKFCWAG
jgi:hypothetical protein